MNTPHASWRDQFTTERIRSSHEKECTEGGLDSQVPDLLEVEWLVLENAYSEGACASGIGFFTSVLYHLDIMFDEPPFDAAQKAEELAGMIQSTYPEILRSAGLRPDFLYKVLTLTKPQADAIVLKLQDA